MFVLGTAGHVDHGKSALVKALTGIDPDRLPEEKNRGLTIDLGFAWYTAVDDTPIGIVDVPGHERFIKNMIAGVGAIDFVLFVVAADDGWMPQSTEHFDILRFLDVKHGLVAVTKVDLVKPDWLELVVDDIKDKMADTFLAEAPIIPVSSITGAGLDDLKTAIDKLIGGLPRREDLGRPRLFLDRAFTIAGRGSVVTGTLIEGSFAVGDDVMLVPSGHKARVRELQSHKQKVERVGPGRRVAVNLSGIERSDLARGECLVKLEDARTYTFMLVRLSLLADSKWSIKTGRKLLALLGTAEPEAVCRLLETDEIKPGESAIAELRLSSPVKARLGDRFVLRVPTPGVTIGGGQVLDFPAHRVTRSNTVYLALLQRRAEKISLPVILQTEMAKEGWLSATTLPADVPYSATAIQQAITDFIDTGEWSSIAKGYVDAGSAEKLKTGALELLQRRHQDQPFTYGYNETEWQKKLRVPGELFKALLISWLDGGLVKVKDGRYYLPDFSPGLPAAWQAEADRLEKLIVDGGMAPPVRSELENTGEHAREIISLWLSMGQMVGLPEGVIYPLRVLNEAIDKIREICAKNGSITVAQARDALGTTRKYVVPLLTHTDKLGLTRREGDLRHWIAGD
ncbi:selenocysteine-specific translation elongation factor [Candidatus Zixiibacteriota bacterium]